MRRFKIVFFLLLVSASKSSMLSAQQPSDYLHYYSDYESQVQIIETDNSGIVGVALECDSQGVIHVLFVKQSKEGEQMYWTVNSTGSYSEPICVMDMTPHCVDLVSIIDRKDRIHLAWQDETQDDFGNLHYACIENGEVIQHQIICTERCDKPDIELNDLDPVIVFGSQILEQRGYEDRISLAFSHAGIFDEPVFYQLPEAFNLTWNQMELRKGIPYFLLSTDTFSLELSRYEDGSFTVPVVITDHMVYERTFPPKMLIDRNDNINVFYRKDGWPDDDSHQCDIYHLVLDAEGEPIEPRRAMIEVSEDWFPMSEPFELSDGSIVWPMVYMGIDMFNFVYSESLLYQIDRRQGAGFGNPVFLTNTIYTLLGTRFVVPGVIRPIGDDEFVSYSYQVLSGGAHPDVRLTELRIRKEQSNTPFIDFNFGGNFYQNYTRSDVINWTIDLFNPTDADLDVEMAILIVIDVPGSENQYFFLSARNGFPTLETEYYGFPLTLLAGEWFQNISLFKLDLNGYDGGRFRIDAMAVLIDPISKSVVSNLNTDIMTFNYPHPYW